MPNLQSSLRKLSVKERLYVESRLSGLSQVASAAAAGYSRPRTDCSRVEKQENVQEAMMTAMSDLSEEIGFTRKEAHDMLMNAYMNAATAAEQIQAVKEMINLHGLAAPKVVEHEHTHKGSVTLERMEMDELLKIADMEDLTLEGEFEIVKEEDERDEAKLLPELQ